MLVFVRNEVQNWVKLMPARTIDIRPVNELSTVILDRARGRLNCSVSASRARAKMGDPKTSLRKTHS